MNYVDTIIQLKLYNDKVSSQSLTSLSIELFNIIINFPIELDTAYLIKCECLESMDDWIKKLKKKRKVCDEI